jgi:ubiquinone/menaquinone biosynthesis C-methylase UbiE
VNEFLSKTLPGHHAWNDIDRTTDPRWFITYLDSSRAEKVKRLESDLRQSFDYLDIHEGQQILEVGCGTADQLAALARLVGCKGRVVGIDKSEIMVSEARSRLEGLNLPIECLAGDIYHLDFPANTFDRCYASAVFQHLEDPLLALSEMVRVVRPGGRIVVTEQDWETQIISSDNHALTRRVLNFFCDEIRNGWAGRKLSGWFQRLGLQNIVVTPINFFSSDYAQTARKLDLNGLVARAAASGVVSLHEGQQWLKELEDRGRNGTFFRALTSFRVHGQKRYPDFL